MQLERRERVGEELKNYKVLLALFCFVLYESIWEVWTRRGGGGGGAVFFSPGQNPPPPPPHDYRSRGNSRTLALSDSPKTE